jgi:phenylpyruvate tautomerase PptA (4-oxalocrotonate tautomerase family)
MPYLQLDIGRSFPAGTKRALAMQLSRTYAEIMQTRAEKVVVAVRELGEGNIWRCNADCAPAAVLKCDIRSGRPAEQRARLAARLVEVCARLLEFDPDLLTVEFTQHAGDEVYRPGRGFVGDWSSAEASKP